MLNNPKANTDPAEVDTLSELIPPTGNPRDLQAKTSTDPLGDRLKKYEARETSRRFLPLVPVYARIDGRSFSKFTSEMAKPFDEQFMQAMIDTTAHLVQETNATCGYTQSDEISLLFYSDSPKNQIFFDGKIFKMVSVLAALATGKFMSIAQEHWPELCKKTIPVFDCRIFELPTKAEAANAFLWRQQDATKNAINSAAHVLYGTNALIGINSNEKQELLFQKGINFNDYTYQFKRGVFVRKRKELIRLTEEELEKIPEQHRPSGPIERSKTVTFDLPPLSRLTNKEDVIFKDAVPVYTNRELS